MSDDDQNDFAAKADAFVAALIAFQQELQALQEDIRKAIAKMDEKGLA